VRMSSGLKSPKNWVETSKKQKHGRLKPSPRKQSVVWRYTV
jgi:hypothetical protein